MADATTGSANTWFRSPKLRLLAGTIDPFLLADNEKGLADASPFFVFLTLASSRQRRWPRQPYRTYCCK